MRGQTHSLPFRRGSDLTGGGYAAQKWAEIDEPRADEFPRRRFAEIGVEDIATEEARASADIAAIRRCGRSRSPHADSNRTRRYPRLGRASWSADRRPVARRTRCGHQGWPGPSYPHTDPQESGVHTHARRAGSRRRTSWRYRAPDRTARCAASHAIVRRGPFRRSIPDIRRQRRQGSLFTSEEIPKRIAHGPEGGRRKATSGWLPRISPAITPPW